MLRHVLVRQRTGSAARSAHRRVGNTNLLRSGFPCGTSIPESPARCRYSGQDPTSPAVARQSPSIKTSTAHAPRPLRGGIGDSPVATRPLDLLDSGERQRDAVVAFPKKLHEGLSRIGHHCPHPNGWWTGNAGIGPEIRETCLAARPSAQGAMASDDFPPGIDLIAREVASPALPKIVEVGPACRDDGRILCHQAELMIAVQRRLREIGRGDYCPAREQVELSMQSPDSPNLCAGIEQHSQRRDIADALGKVDEVETGDDLNAARVTG